MDNWSDTHGEEHEALVRKPSRTSKWCDNCHCFVERVDFVRWSPDGSFTHFLCPGCDAEIGDPEPVDE